MHIQKATHISQRMLHNKRIRVITRTLQSDNAKTVFQLNRHTKVSLADIDECLEASKNMKQTDKADYFCNNGIDYDNVCKYHGLVLQLNRSMQQKTDSPKGTQQQLFWHSICAHLAFIRVFF